MFLGFNGKSSVISMATKHYLRKGTQRKGWKCSELGAVTFAILTLACTAKAVSNVDTVGWTDLSIDYDSRVVGAETWLNQNAYNARQCMKMCWLYSACSALTFIQKQQECQLFRLEGDKHVYTTARERGSLAVYMASARRVPATTKRVLYGCDKRPCSESEVCLQVRNHVSYICVSLVSIFCREDPPHIPNSDPHSDGVSSVVYACAYAYSRRGTSFISKCDHKTGAWSEVDLTCTFVDCGSPPDLYGAMANGLSTTLNSVISYTCLAGAVPSTAQITVTCEESGQWSHLPGSCSMVICNQPPAVDNMEAVVTPRSTTDAFPELNAQELQRAYGAEAVYTCSSGYFSPEGANYIAQCQADGTWSSTANFLCSPVECGEPSAVANSSQVSHKATTFGANATVMCLPGFSPLEGFSLACDENGNWIGSVQTCNLVECENPPQVDHAQVQFSRVALDSKAKYECLEGSIKEGEGNFTSTCQMDGAWSPVSAWCLPIPCGPAPSVDNSSVTYTAIHEGFMAQYSCDPGYIFNSSATTRQCLRIDNTWSGQDVICKEATCSAAPNVSHATVMESGRRFPSQAFYTCDLGYILTSAASTKTCTLDGTWSHEDVVCDPIMCHLSDLPEYAVVSHGVAASDSYDHGDTLAFSCQGGHIMIPASSSSSNNTESYMTCAEGNWTMAASRCIPCNEPPVIDHATWEIPVEKPAKVMYKCDTGYLLTSGHVDTLTCLENTGTWREGDGIRCEPVDCGEPPPIGNGTFSNTGNKYNDSVIYSCDLGYRGVAGDGERICNEVGNWTGTQLVCAEWNCEPPSHLADGTVKYTNTSVKSSAVYICDPGFKMTILNKSRNALEQRFVCNEETTQWVTEEGIFTDALACHQISCPQPPAIPSSRVIDGAVTSYAVNSTVQYACLDGYKLWGLEPVITCGDDETWSHPYFECLMIDCGPPQPVRNAIVATENGTGVNSEAVYTCENGYTLVSKQQKKICGKDGLWSPQFIECVPGSSQHCGEPPIVENAVSEIFSAQAGETALYKCIRGYRHFWTNSYVCNSTFFRWLGTPEVKCVPVDCGKAPNVPHADIINENTTVGGMVFYECHAGMVSPNANSYECTSSGTWTTEPLVECLSATTTTCGLPPQLENSGRTYANTSLGSVATYVCDDGFFGVPFEALCGADGIWTFQGSHGCSPIVCGDPPHLDNTKATHVSGNTYGEVVVYECLENYVHTGPSLKMCQVNSMWSSNIVECVHKTKTFCSDAPVRDKTIVLYSSRAEGAAAVYNCIAGYSGPSAHSACNSRGLWSEPDIECKPKLCWPPAALSFSKVVPGSVAMNVGHSVVHVCDPTFFSTTLFPLISICLETGMWSDASGSCEPAMVQDAVVCSSEIPSVPNGKIHSQTSNRVGGLVSYTCEVGYFPVPPPEVFFHTCLPGGIWSSELLACKPSLCVINAPTSFPNAVYVNLTRSEHGAQTMKGEFECAEGYSDDRQVSTVGNITSDLHVLCNMLTGWHSLDTLDGCEPVNCGPITPPTHLQATSNNTQTTYKSEVELFCRPPLYQSIPDNESNNTAVCSAKGTWSFDNVILSCAPCEQSQDAFNISNGLIEIYSEHAGAGGIGDKATLWCATDFVRINNVTGHCKSVDGKPTWIGLENSRCAQTDWWNITKGDDGRAFPIDRDGIINGLLACAIIQFVNVDRLQTVLHRTVNLANSVIIRVVYDTRRQPKVTKLQYSASAEDAELVTAQTLEEKLFSDGETATLCFNLDIPENRIQFVKNGEVWMSIRPPSYDAIAWFRVSHDVTVIEVHLNYY